MSRPKHPNCPMPKSTIRRINEKQRAYDRNPEKYERKQREQERQQRIRERQLEQLRQEQLEEQHSQEQRKVDGTAIDKLDDAIAKAEGDRDE